MYLIFRGTPGRPVPVFLGVSSRDRCGKHLLLLVRLRRTWTETCRSALQDLRTALERGPAYLAEELANSPVPFPPFQVQFLGWQLSIGSAHERHSTAVSWMS